MGIRGTVGHYAAIMITVGFGLTGLGSKSFGDPVVEKIDRASVNWGKMTVQFYGEGQGVEGASSVDFKKGENTARQEGIVYFDKTVGELRKTLGQDLSEGIGAQAFPKAKSVNTVYFPNGKVRVEMEAPLPEVLQPRSIQFAHHEMGTIEAGQVTGLVVKLDKPLKPRAVFHIVDESGNSLYEAGHVSQKAFEKGFMGRFLRRPGKNELTEITGNNAAVLDGSIAAAGEIVIRRDVWDKAMDSGAMALRNGAVALVVP